MTLLLHCSYVFFCIVVTFARANACCGACKTFQPNDADHENGKIMQQLSMKGNLFRLISLWILGIS